MGYSEYHIKVKSEELLDLTKVPGILDKYLGLLDGDEKGNDFYVTLAGDGNVCNLGNRWQAIYYLLTGEIAEIPENPTPPFIFKIINCPCDQRQ